MTIYSVRFQNISQKWSKFCNAEICRFLGDFSKSSHYLDESNGFRFREIALTPTIKDKNILYSVQNHLVWSGQPTTLLQSLNLRNGESVCSVHSDST